MAVAKQQQQQQKLLPSQQAATVNWNPQQQQAAGMQHPFATSMNMANMLSGAFPGNQAYGGMSPDMAGYTQAMQTQGLRGAQGQEAAAYQAAQPGLAQAQVAREAQPWDYAGTVQETMPAALSQNYGNLLGLLASLGQNETSKYGAQQQFGGTVPGPYYGASAQMESLPWQYASSVTPTALQTQLGQESLPYNLLAEIYGPAAQATAAQNIALMEQSGRMSGFQQMMAALMPMAQAAMNPPTFAGISADTGAGYYPGA